MRLTEFAHKLKDVFNFRYLTVESASFDIIKLHITKPEWVSSMRTWIGDEKLSIQLDTFVSYKDQRPWELPEYGLQIDLNEYMKGGIVDYSKCIIDLEAPEKRNGPEKPDKDTLLPDEYIIGEGVDAEDLENIVKMASGGSVASEEIDDNRKRKGRPKTK